MESLRSWLNSAALVAIVSGAVTLLSPDGSIKKYVKYLGALTVLLVLLLPLSNQLGRLAEGFGDIFDAAKLEPQDAEGSYRELLCRESELAIEKEIESFYAADCTVTLELSEDCEPLGCTVALPSSFKKAGGVYAALIEVKASELAGCEAKVVYSEDGDEAN